MYPVLGRQIWIEGRRESIRQNLKAVLEYRDRGGNGVPSQLRAGGD